MVFCHPVEEPPAEQPRPGHVSVSGGETFLALCRRLNVDYLALLGEHAPGSAASRLVGGVWDGATVLSKSGASGDEAFWSRLLGGEPDATGGHG